MDSSVIMALGKVAIALTIFTALIYGGILLLVAVPDIILTWRDIRAKEKAEKERQKQQKEKAKWICQTLITYDKHGKEVRFTA